MSKASFRPSRTETNKQKLDSSETLNAPPQTVVLRLLTLLSVWVGLDLQDHGGDGVSVHVVERVGEPLRTRGGKKTLKRDQRAEEKFKMSEMHFNLGSAPNCQSMSYVQQVRYLLINNDRVSDLQHHHAGFMNQSDAVKDPHGDFLCPLHLLHVT